jgi:hypothetical protein
LRRLDDEARRLERHAPGPSVEDFIARERRLSHSYEGRTVFGWVKPETGPPLTEVGASPFTLARNIPSGAA